MPLTPNNREEHWLQGMVDGSTNLEPNKRREYWYKEIVDAIGSGGGGGGGVLVVNFDGGTGALDKTWNEINSASFAVVKLNTATPPIISTGLVCETRINDGTEYKVAAYLPSEGETVGFVTSSADGYPVIQTP